jgi:hypothetical protein
LASSVRTVVANNGHTITANNATIYAITSANVASGGTPQLLGLSTSTMAVQSTTTLPVQYLMGITRNISASQLIAVFGRMSWNTIGIFIYNTQSGTPVLEHSFTKTATADPTALLYTGRFLYIGSPKPNTIDFLNPYGMIEVINLETLTKPLLSRTALHLPAPPHRFAPIETSEFRFVTLGDVGTSHTAAYVIPVRSNGSQFTALRRMTIMIPVHDIAVRSRFTGLERSHTLYAATNQGIIGYSINESDLSITPVTNWLTRGMTLPLQKFTTLALSPGGSYLYGGGVDASGDYGMVVALDIRSTPRYVGFFGEYGFLPTRLLTSATKLTHASANIIVTTIQMSAVTGAP